MKEYKKKKCSHSGRYIYHSFDKKYPSTVNLFNALLILFLLIISSGCATIIHGTTQDIGITTDPSGADLLVDGREQYKSPAIIPMKRKNDHMVEISKDGYQKEAVNIKREFSWATAGDVFAGGAIGYVVDATTGSQCRLIPEHVDVRLHPLTTKAVRPVMESQESIKDKLKQLKKLKDN